MICGGYCLQMIKEFNFISLLLVYIGGGVVEVEPQWGAKKLIETFGSNADRIEQVRQQSSDICSLQNVRRRRMKCTNTRVCSTLKHVGRVHSPHQNKAANNNVSFRIA